jgi:hypothetical protein
MKVERRFGGALISEFFPASFFRALADLPALLFYGLVGITQK